MLQAAHETRRNDLVFGHKGFDAYHPILRIAKAAGLGWAAVHLADRPGDAALLAKAAALCK